MLTTSPIIDAGSYRVYIGTEIFSALNDLLNAPGSSFSSVVVLADENSFLHCLPVFASKSEKLKQAPVIRIQPGEQHKNIQTCSTIWQRLGELGADRKSLLVNIGGGVIGDMGGFAASTYKRGIAFINIPTTLLAQVDASVGGKLGIDFNAYKNEIGVFKDPLAVFIYPPVLKTLEIRQQLSGFAEVIKHGLIADAGYWKKIKSISPYEINEEWEELISHSVSIKNSIVQEDPLEKGVRKKLNYGHTIGHALESFFLTGHGKDNLLHGEAIAAGMICESYLSHKFTGLTTSALEEITEYIRSLYTRIPVEKIDRDALMNLMIHDKKNESGRIRFTLLNKIGESVIDQECSSEEILNALDFYDRKSKP